MVFDHVVILIFQTPFISRNLWIQINGIYAFNSVLEKQHIRYHFPLIHIKTIPHVDLRLLRIPLFVPGQTGNETH